MVTIYSFCWPKYDNIHTPNGIDHNVQGSTIGTNHDPDYEIVCESERSIKSPSVYHDAPRKVQEATNHIILEYYQDRRKINKP